MLKKNWYLTHASISFQAIRRDNQTLVLADNTNYSLSWYLIGRNLSATIRPCTFHFFNGQQTYDVYIPITWIVWNHTPIWVGGSGGQFRWGKWLIRCLSHISSDLSTETAWSHCLKSSPVLHRVIWEQFPGSATLLRTSIACSSTHSESYILPWTDWVTGHG